MFRYSLPVPCVLLAISFLLLFLTSCAEGEAIGTLVNQEEIPVNQLDGDTDGDSPDGDSADGDSSDGDGDGADGDGDNDPIGDGDGGEDGDGDRDDPLQNCSSNDDCSGIQICVRSAPGQEGTCQNPSENRADGASCSTSNQCESGLCYDQTCTRECQDLTDCEEEWICRDHGAFGVCEAPVGCSASSGCDVGGDICVVHRTTPQVICQPPLGDGELGDSCTEDHNCEAGLCLDGACSQPCTSPSDCGTSGEYLCTLEDLGGLNLNVCTERPLESCLSDADCDGTERCVATIRENNLLFACGEPNAGGGEGAVSCTTDAQCAQNLCLDGACAAPCDGNNACTAIPASSCESSTVTRDSASGSVSTCSVPQYCNSSSICGINETCYVVYASNSLERICRAPNSTNRQDGEACSTNSQCASNYCRVGRFGNYCSTPCQVNGDCPASADGFAMECAPVSLDHAGNQESFTSCVRATPAPCASTADCAAGETCKFAANEAGTALETLCLPSTGGQAPGLACDVDSDCSSGHCLDDGYCSAPCSDRDQCHEFQLCETATATVDNLSGTFSMCTEVPFTPCTSSLDCSPSGLLTCNVLFQDAQNNLNAFCWFKNQGGAVEGALCTEDSTCESDFCWTSEDNTAGECSVVCENSTRDCGSGQVCAGIGSDLRTCLSECNREADCIGGNVCRLGLNEENTAPQTYCSGTLGESVTGDSCDTAIDCATGLCLTVTSYAQIDQFCGLPDDLDCPAEYPLCACPLDDPDCSAFEQVCSSEEEVSVCSEICDTANGDSDCAGSHDLSSCSDSITVTWPGGQDTISACSFGLED